MNQSMIKITEDKLLAFEAFLTQQNNQGKQAFDAFNSVNRDIADKAVIDILEENDGTMRVINFYSE